MKITFKPFSPRCHIHNQQTCRKSTCIWIRYVNVYEGRIWNDVLIIECSSHKGNGYWACMRNITLEGDYGLAKPSVPQSKWIQNTQLVKHLTTSSTYLSVSFNTCPLFPLSLTVQLLPMKTKRLGIDNCKRISNNRRRKRGRPRRQTDTKFSPTRLFQQGTHAIINTTPVLPSRLTNLPPPGLEKDKSPLLLLLLYLHYINETGYIQFTTI